MKIKKMERLGVGRDFYADMECEHCGHVQKLKSGYDDANYHNNVIPQMTCASCGKMRSGEIPAQANDNGFRNCKPLVKEEQAGLPKVTMGSVTSFLAAHEVGEIGGTDAIVALVTLLDLTFKEGFKLCLRTYERWLEHGGRPVTDQQKAEALEAIDMATFGCTDDGLILLEFNY